ncbi:MAG: 2-(1,2-epoxy-1,2-dihydrophenyl)acetyl-CoA isomerase [Marinicaulis sp.]|nr:2-(1,2-epoxy-1,2-dihydrophenyl)acetyl-CoA isomerase [Marinicaulis sp.]NNL88793.1 2-(1,2-epoxy-1,2-dihydrophenyl)acetyl-CoA isomerase [Marinicaulis sp.]
MTEAQQVEYEKRGDVAIIYLNDPDSLNAITLELGNALIATLDRASKEARAIVLSSRGRAFSSGANLAAGGNEDLAKPDRDLGEQLDKMYNPLIRMLRDLPAPLVTAVRGPAAGVGCSIACMGDIIVAGKGAYFLQAFCNIGLVPDGGSTYLLAKAIGRVRAMELMLLGERYPAERAFQDGLVTRLVDDDDVERTAIEIAEKLAAGPTQALAMIRKAAWAALDSNLDDQLDLERTLQRDAGRSDDFLEGVAAFFGKRKAQFKGK